MQGKYERVSEGQRSRWMLTSCANYDKEKISQLLSEYWQPFAVTEFMGETQEAERASTIWFRKFEGRRVRRIDGTN